MASNQVIILTIDGGGIRGIIPAYILNQIEQKTGKLCYQLFDIIGGTSTGGIITAGLTTISPASGNLPFTASYLLKIYMNDAAQIFVPQNRDLYATYFGDDGKGKGIEPYLRQMVGTTLLSAARTAIQSLPGARIKQMFTTGYTVNSTGNTISNPVHGQDYGPYLFNWDAAGKNAIDNYCVWEAARASSAAPTYFPIAYVGGNLAPRSGANPRWVVDGGMMSNNPTIWAVTEAFRLGYAQSLSDITVISIGTGVYQGACGAGIHTNKGFDCPDNGNWSISPWMGEDMLDLEGNKSRGLMVNIILDAVQLVAGSQLRALREGGLNYYRLEPDIPVSMAAMDNISPQNIKNLVTAAGDYLAGKGASKFAEVLSVFEASNVVAEPV